MVEISHKKCTICGDLKEIVQFSVRKKPRPGINSVCKICDAARAAKWRASNRERHRAAGASYRARFPDRVKETMRRWYEKNADYKKTAAREWRRLNSAKIACSRQQKKQQILAGNRLREERLRLATPDWLDQPQKREIMACYVLAQAQSDVLGEKYDVDHVIPLKGRNFSGLHVPWNLQVLHGRKNRQKKNSTPTADEHLFVEGARKGGHGLPDGSFYVPERIVAALGNGSADAGRSVLDCFVAITRRHSGKKPRSITKRGRL